MILTVMVMVMVYLLYVLEKKTEWIIGIVAGCVVGVGVVAIVGYLIYKKQHEQGRGGRGGVGGAV